MSFVKLERCSDWGWIYFALPGKGLSERGTADLRKYAIVFKEGESVQVRFPDGTAWRTVVEHKEFHGEVSDHGHADRFTYSLPGFTARVRPSNCTPLDSWM